MKRLVQPYYLLALLIGGAIFWFNATNRSTTTYFYGFAENLETEVNFNYPVIVKELLVQEGEAVKAGESLLHLQRIKPKDELAEESFKITELQARTAAWLAEREGELSILESKHRIDGQERDARVREIEAEIASRKKLYGGLSSLQDVTLDFAALQQELEALQAEQALRDSLYRQEAANLRREMDLGIAPYRSEVERLEAKQQFDAEQQVIDIHIEAPFDGIVGNISCKGGEHIPSFKTLLTYYEPNPTVVKGYVFEALLADVHLADRLLVRSTSNPEQSCMGVVSGLGSRIVEIPTRLRKFEDVKTYGREILVTLPTDNPFIQKEKVELEVLE